MSNLGVFVLACTAAYCSAEDSMARPTVPPVKVAVDTKHVLVESFMGLGVQWGPYEYVPSPAAWKLTLKRLDFLKPAFVRVMSGAHAYCLGFADDGTPEYIWEQSEEAIQERLGTML